MLEQRLIKLQNALLEGRIDQQTYEELRSDLLQAKGTSASPLESSNDVAQLLEKADAHFGDDEYHKALDLLDRAVEVAPSCVEAYFARGWTHLCLGDDRKAGENLKKALHLDPRHVPSLCLQAERAASQGQFEVSIAALNRAVHAEPKNAQPLYYRALAYESWARATGSKDKLAKALEDFQAAHALNSECEVPDYSSDHPSEIDWVALRGLPEPEILAEDPLVINAVPYVETFAQTEEGRVVNFYCGQCGILQHHPATVIGRQQECVQCGTLNQLPSDVVQGAWKAVKATGLIVGGIAVAGLSAFGGIVPASDGAGSGGRLPPGMRACPGCGRGVPGADSPTGKQLYPRCGNCGTKLHYN